MREPAYDVMRGALAYLFNRPLVFAETSADELGQLPRFAHLRNGAMKDAARDALLMFALAGALGAWQVYLNSLPLGPGNEPLDWRYHAVWIYPLLLTAVAPFVMMKGCMLPTSAVRPPSFVNSCSAASSLLREISTASRKTGL